LPRSRAVAMSGEDKISNKIDELAGEKVKDAFT
jgi:hypothetical protein